MVCASANRPSPASTQPQGNSGLHHRHECNGSTTWAGMTYPTIAAKARPCTNSTKKFSPSILHPNSKALTVTTCQRAGTQISLPIATVLMPKQKVLTS